VSRSSRGEDAIGCEGDARAGLAPRSSGTDRRYDSTESSSFRTVSAASCLSDTEEVRVPCGGDQSYKHCRSSGTTSDERIATSAARAAASAVREFIMKDSYSLDRDQAGPGRSFEKNRVAYDVSSSAAG